MPPTDLFTFSPPCVDFSSEGAMRGERGTTGSLYRSSLAYIRVNRPRAVLYGNVAVQYTHRKHRPVVKKLIRTLQRCGYRVHARILNTCNHGVPQFRRRFYIVALHKVQQRHRFTWPAKVPLKYTMQDVVKTIPVYT